MQQSARTIEFNPLYWYYGSGAFAFGVKNYAFSYLLLTFSTHVLGIPGVVASLALGIAIMWDAVSDPLLGHWSDKTRSRLGRRHPFMYASLLIFPLSFWLIFNPIIEINESNGFFYLLILAILIRTGTTLFEVPSIALLPELEKDYDRRSRWLALRHVFGWYAGNGIHMINFLIWVGAYGLAVQKGYTIFATVATGIIILAIVVSSAGTQRFARSLPQPRETFKIGEILREMTQIFQSLRNRNFAALFAYGLFNGLAGGISTVLYLYNTTYFFAFTGRQIGLTAIVVLLAPALAYVIGPALGRLWGKKIAAIVTILVYVGLYPIPYVLVIFGLWPELGSWASWGYYSVVIVIEVTCVVIGALLLDSMMADVVEHSEINTDRRSEGLFFAARAFASKAMSAGGIVIAGTIVTLVGLDVIGSADLMTEGHRIHLAALFLPIFCGLNFVALTCISLYRIGREDHVRNLATLEQRKGQEAPV